MNKKITFILLFVSSILFGQSNDYATVSIYRTKSFCIGCNIKFYLNDVYLTNIDNGGELELKVFNTKNTKLTIVDAVNNRLETTIHLRKGKHYYFNAKALFPRYKGFKFEQLNKPVKSKKLKSNRFISMSDVGLLDNNISRKPDTEWTKEKLKKYWIENGTKDIEGIYEKVGTYLEYELAVIKENNNYRIIYLSGASGTNWNEGDIKATLQKTAQFGLFKSNWFMLNKSFNDDIIITFENATMKCLSENGRDKDLYIKIYPTYDSDDNKTTVNANWKSSGTGFFIDKKGYLATNYHVIKNANSIEITYNNQNYKAKVIISDKQNDLAILKINDDKFKPLNSLDYNFEIKTSNVGKSVFTLGFPETQLMGSEIKLTNGIINSKTGFKGSISEYQISAQIQHGNSGGPLFDNNGNLLGITSSGLRSSEIENVNYAIKTKYLNLLVEELGEEIQLPNSRLNENKPLEEKYEILKKYVVFIKVK